MSARAPRAPAAAVRRLSPEARLPAACLAAFLVVWTVLAIAPSDRADWLLENLLTFVAVPALVLGWWRFRLSNRAYVQLTVFFVLHTVGSHWTYSEVPFGHWLRDAFDLARNPYDRMVHFAFGLLLLRPISELGFRPRRRPGRFGVFFFSVAGVALWSATYEVLEWLVARAVDPAAGTAFLGTQGDEWDAVKDMACALSGALIAGAMAWAADRRR